MSKEQFELRKRLRDAATKVLSTNSSSEEVKIKFHDNETDKLLTIKSIDAILQELEDEFFKEDKQ